MILISAVNIPMTENCSQTREIIVAYGARNQTGMDILP
jgi:glucose/arabinose dehydrogenase